MESIRNYFKVLSLLRPYNPRAAQLGLHLRPVYHIKEHRQTIKRNECRVVMKGHLIKKWVQHNYLMAKAVS